MENKNDIFNKTPKGGKPKMFRFNLYWMYGLIFIMLVALYMTNDSSGAKELGWTEFQKLAQENVFDKNDSLQQEELGGGYSEKMERLNRSLGIWTFLKSGFLRKYT